MMRDLRFFILHHTRGWTASSAWLTIVLALAIATFYAVSVDPAFSGRSLLDRLYIVLLLMTFGGDDLTLVSDNAISPGYPVLLFRIVLPLVALGGLLLVIFRNSGQWVQYHLMPKREHTVLFGLSKAGLSFASNWSDLANKRKFGPLIIVEPDITNPNIEVAREFGLPVITGAVASTGSRVFARAKCENATRIISMMSSDSKDVELALYLQHYLSTRNSGNKVVRLMVNIDEARLAQRLATYPRLHRATNIDLQFNSLYNLYAEDFFLRYPPDVYADVFDCSSPVIAIHEFNSLSEQLVIYASFLCHYRNAEKTKIIILDERHSQAEKALKESYPGFFSESSNLDLSFMSDLSEWPVQADQTPITQHVVCNLDEEQALSYALRLREKMFSAKNDNAPIFIKCSSKNGISELLVSNADRAEIPDGLYPFGTLDYATHPESIDNRLLSAVARSVHEMSYQAIYDGAPTWEESDATKKKSNKLAVLHFDTKLRSIGCRRVSVPGRKKQKEFRENFEDRVLKHYSSVTGSQGYGGHVLRRLSMTEHNRWVGYHFGLGWRSSENRLDALKLHNLIKGWEDLEEKEKQKDESQIRLLPAILEGNKLHVERLVKEELVKKNLIAEQQSLEGSCSEPQPKNLIEEDLEKKVKTKILSRVSQKNLEHVDAIKEFGQFMMPKHTIGIVFPLVIAGDLMERVSIDECVLGADEAGNRIKEKVQKALGDIEDPAAFTVITTLTSSPEQLAHAKIEELLESKIRLPREWAGQTGPKSLIETLVTLPTPYPFLKEHGFFKRKKSCCADDQRFQESVGQKNARYVELPMQRQGVDFVRKGVSTREAINEQFEFSWDWIAQRSDTLIILVAGKYSKRNAEKLNERLKGIEPGDEDILPRPHSSKRNIVIVDLSDA